MMQLPFPYTACTHNLKAHLCHAAVLRGLRIPLPPSNPVKSEDDTNLKLRIQGLKWAEGSEIRTLQVQSMIPSVYMLFPAFMVSNSVHISGSLTLSGHDFAYRGIRTGSE